MYQDPQEIPEDMENLLASLNESVDCVCHPSALLKFIFAGICKTCMRKFNKS
jgi:hypothetical protein